MKLIYADNNATTAVAPEVCQAMAPFFTENYFNPSSMYAPALEVAWALSQSRATVARLLGLAEPTQILFTSCPTESNNTAIRSDPATPNRRHLITTAVEHPAVLDVCKDLRATATR